MFVVIISDISRRTKYNGTVATTSQKTNPGRLVKTKNATNAQHLYWKDKLDFGSGNIIRFYQNEAFLVNDLSQRQILETIGQHVAKILLESDESRWVFRAEKSGAGHLQYVSYNENKEIIGIKEGVNKFTGVSVSHTSNHPVGRNLCTDI